MSLNFEDSMQVIDFQDASEGRYDRHQLISWWDQERVSRAKVIVVGVGALGNEVLKLLALIGVGHVQIIDFDTISPSNLARMVLFRQMDIGRSKIDVAIERLREINPEISVDGIQGDLRYDIGLGDYRAADLVFGCLDSVNSRWALNRKCMLAGVEWIDGGISDFHGQVVRYKPQQGACYECNFTEQTYERFNRRYSCPFGLINTQAEPKVPTTAVTTSVIAAIQVQQALMILHGIEDGLQPGQRLMVYLKPYMMSVDTLRVNSECLAHVYLPNDIPIIDCHPETTCDELITQAQIHFPGVDSLYLDFDLVVDFVCDHCHTRQPVNRPKDKVNQAEATCPKCGQLRVPESISTIQAGSAFASLQLRQIGIPPREILGFMGNNEMEYAQIGT
jgi:molybdopterin/thiamine biosynthesis adenylyltransferase